MVLTLYVAAIIGTMTETVIPKIRETVTMGIRVSILVCMTTLQLLQTRTVMMDPKRSVWN